MTRLAPGPHGAGVPTGAAPTELFGRRAETAVLDELLSQAREGSGGALVLWGEPGIGKSALLRYAHDRAADFLRLSHPATRPESDLAFAGLHGLLRPVTDRVESLVTAQAPALRAALGASGEPANRLLVGAAVLSLLCGLAERQPVLVVVDNGQWLDEATARCLGFVARRVRAHPVVVVLADHSDPAVRQWEGMADVRVEGLTDESARRLVATVAPFADETTVRNTVGEAGGNPLALHEMATLGSGLDDAERRHGQGEPPVGPRLQRAFRAGIEALSPPAQLLTVLAAAEEHGDRLTVQRAGCVSGVDDTAWEEATNAGLLRVVGNRVGFRHPVVSRAVYEGCGAAVRRRAHHALAATLPDEAEERVWHLAAVAHDRDENVATLLEQAAARSRLRAATATAARALRRAAELSATPIGASQRLAEAARASWDAGCAATAARLLDEAERLAPGAHVARHSRGLRGVLEFARGMPELAHHYLTTDMHRVSGPDTALELATMAMRADWSMGRGDLRAGSLELFLARDAEDRTGLPGPPARWSDDASADAFEADDAVTPARTTALPLLPPTPLALAWGIDKPMRDALRLGMPHLRQGGERAGLADALARTAILDNVAGRWTEAESSATEGLRLAEEMGADHIASDCRTSLGWLAAARGDEQAVTEVTARTLETSLPRGVRALSAAAYWNRGMASLFQERPDEALDTLVRLAEPGHGAEHPTFALLAALDTAEAAVHVGRHDLAEERVRALEAWGRRTGAPWARSAAHVARALLPGPRVEHAFRAALDVPGARSHPLLHARAQLFYGEWLRRGRRRIDARVQIGAAIEVFDRLGAEPLHRRARREQELTGPPGRRGSLDTDEVNRLTLQEQRVAQLAAEQLTNREIAVQLRISHRTVGHHLGNVFAKLGINTRTELSCPAGSEPR
ncbi:LuxR family transcriptional regulator [Streptomyces sp. MP131-18]|uniref:LuxR family transcriptional regulator n=1 Tax=Streptomyces sp. MP131-18 TaxID=1857892 RepID=UPI00097C677A|nr:LuxR family transcriptional regulator [Streptomyces sp. MP131-18]ONK09590.1 two component system sensor kinase SsrB [Streptomyces sp. MP131-18]